MGRELGKDSSWTRESTLLKSRKGKQPPSPAAAARVLWPQVTSRAGEVLQSPVPPGDPWLLLSINSSGFLAL